MKLSKEKKAIISSSQIKFIYSLFSVYISKNIKKWFFRKVGFFPDNQSFLKTYEISLIGWIKLALHKGQLLFRYVNMLFNCFFAIIPNLRCIALK